MSSGRTDRVSVCVWWPLFWWATRCDQSWLDDCGCCTANTQPPSYKIPPHSPPPPPPIPPIPPYSTISSWVSDVRACILLRADVMSLSMVGPPPLEWLVKNRWMGAFYDPLWWPIQSVWSAGDLIRGKSKKVRVCVYAYMRQYLCMYVCVWPLSLCFHPMVAVILWLNSFIDVSLYWQLHNTNSRVKVA